MKRVKVTKFGTKLAMITITTNLTEKDIEIAEAYDENSTSLFKDKEGKEAEFTLCVDDQLEITDKYINLQRDCANNSGKLMVVVSVEYEEEDELKLFVVKSNALSKKIEKIEKKVLAAVKNVENEYNEVQVTDITNEGE